MNRRGAAGYPIRVPRPRVAGARSAERPLPMPRVVATILLVAAVVCLGVSLATSWWQEQQTVTPTGGGSSSDSETDTLSFTPGNSVVVSCVGTLEDLYASPCLGSTDWTYASGGLSGLENLYVLVQVLGLLAIVLGAFSALFAGMGSVRMLWGRWHFNLTHLMALMAGILCVIAPVTLAGLQPGLLPQSTIPAGSSYQYYFVVPEDSHCGSTSPNGSFWDSCSFTDADRGLSYTATWGAAAGWYLAFLAAFLYFLGGVLFLTSPSDDVRGPGRRASPLAPGGPSGLGGGSWSPGPMGPPSGGTDLQPYAPAGTGIDLDASALTYRGAAVLEGRPRCSACGHLNAPSSALCSRCHAPLPA